MRKFLTWAAVVLLLVVSLQDPVVSRSTPYTADDWGPIPDHPWGGDQNSGRRDAERTATTIGLPAIDIPYLILHRWFFGSIATSREANIISAQPQQNNQPKPQTNGATNNPDRSN